MTSPILTQAILKALLHYDPETGLFTWLPRDVSWFPSLHQCKVWNANYAGKDAGCINAQGYISITLLLKALRAHRLAWLYVYGEWPPCHLDHINHVRTDNRICNLRGASHQINGMNTSMYRRNTSGVTGVSLKDGFWIAQININKKRKYLGRSKDKDEAIALRKQAEIEHGYHPNHGI